LRRSRISHKVVSITGKYISVRNYREVLSVKNYRKVPECQKLTWRYLSVKNYREVPQCQKLTWRYLSVKNYRKVPECKKLELMVNKSNTITCLDRLRGFQ